MENVIKLKRIQFVYNSQTYINEVVVNMDICDHIKEDQMFIFKIDKSTYDYLEHKHIACFMEIPTVEYDEDEDIDGNIIYDTFEGYYDFKINYCPVCGEKIEFKVEEIVDVSDKVVPLIKELEELKQKRDSKARREREREIELEIKNIMEII